MTCRSKARIVLGNSSVVGYPEAGGHFSVFLQYLLGLLDLGHDAYWLEVFHPESEERNGPLTQRFFERLAHYGVADRGIVLEKTKDDVSYVGPFRAHGRTIEEFMAIARSSDVLWNFANAISEPLLSLFKRRALIDIDPGVLQMCADTLDMGQHAHHVFFTVGQNVGKPECAVSTLNLDWHTFFPPVFLPIWMAVPDPGPRAPFTSVTQWSWGEIWAEPHLSVSKRLAYLSYLDLPHRTGRPFQLAANIASGDKTGDRELLAAHGWQLVHAHEVAGSLESYQQFVRSSRAEFLCSKAIFRTLRTGWLSDRSACYLASGRPVLAEDTGLASHLPIGEGLLMFRDVEGAERGVIEIDAHYEQHSRAARRIAEEFLDSRRVLPRVLEACG